MNRRVSVLFAAVLAAALLLLPATATSAEAQEFPAGTWTGTIEPPEGGVMDVEFEVESGDQLAITVKAQGESLPLNGVELVDGVLHFSFNTGTYVACELPANDDGGYEGECVGDDGDVGYITMTPPE